jgi:hypothetical protein
MSVQFKNKMKPEMATTQLSLICEKTEADSVTLFIIDIFGNGDQYFKNLP